MIGIIGAMHEEIEQCLGHMEQVEEKQLASLTYYIGRLHQQPVVLCQSGVGKVNAAICTQIMIDHFKVNQVIFTGVAGGVDPKLNIGDIVISTDCQQHDIDASAIEVLNVKRGEIPFAKTSIFPADQSLIDMAERAGEKLENVQIIKGRVLSGDQFIASRETVKALYEQFNGACVEMEGSAVAQTCYLNGIPFVIIRSLSDKADGTADVNFLEFTKLAAERSYAIVSSMIKQLQS